MRTHSRTARRLAGLVAVVVALGAGPLAGCAEDPAEPPGSAAYDGGTSGGGGGGGTTLTVGVFGAFGLKEAGWVNLHLGRASAIAWAMFLILLVIGALNRLVARRLRRSS
ncbi:hypothetical protein [Streptomyces sp. NBC_01725]|uniref:hypothetical protein n=1 Tax=Streptomyces sp. NBC_01725 TaxID=2975923 RepID=UPI003FCDA4BE